MEGQTFQWQQTDEGQSLDIRVTYQQDGTITLHGIQGGEEQSFDSPNECSNYFRSLLDQPERA